MDRHPLKGSRSSWLSESALNLEGKTPLSVSLAYIKGLVRNSIILKAARRSGMRAGFESP
jgi:hypothetical protein